MIDLEGYVRTGKKLKLGGKDFLFQPLTMRDFALMRKKVVEEHKKEMQQRREARIKEIRDLDGDVPTLELVKYLDQNLTESEIEDMMFGTEGITYAAFLSLRHTYKEIAEEEVADLLTSEDLHLLTDVFEVGEKEPAVSVEMKHLTHSFELKDGRNLTLAELIQEAQKKKRGRPLKRK